MKILKLSLVFSALALFIFACSENKTANTNTNGSNKSNIVVTNADSPTNAPPTAATDELASAKKIYSEKCVRCHKEDGSGGETDIEGTKIKAPNFTSDRMKKKPDSEFIETIEKGATEDGMPAFKGKISNDDIKNLVKLIRRDFQKQ
ncbi:MAG TPA: cytochrome c [Pyrinomonadaceae bacterium]|jgi:mono/diheme cytochrome c family protein